MVCVGEELRGGDDSRFVLRTDYPRLRKQQTCAADCATAKADYQNVSSVRAQQPGKISQTQLTLFAAAGAGYWHAINFKRTLATAPRNTNVSVDANVKELHF